MKDLVVQFQNFGKTIFKSKTNRMNNKLRILSFLFLIAGNICMLSAQIGVGEWRSHYAYHDATQCTMLDGQLFVLSDGSLYSYTPGDTYVGIYNKSTCLSDQGIRFMVKSKQENLLCLVYDNANIDLLLEDEKMCNLPDFATTSSYDPNVNDVTVCGSTAYLATTFGIVAVNLAKKEFTNTYPVKENVLSAASDGHIIVAATENGIFQGSLDDNLLDPANWHQMNTNQFRKVECINGTFIAYSKGYGICTLNAEWRPQRFTEEKFNFMYVVDDRLIAGKDNQLYVWTTVPGNPTIYTTDDDVFCATFDGKDVWTAEGKQGLRGYTIGEGDKLTMTTSSIIPNSPVRNHCDYIRFTDDERLLVAGGCLDYLGTTRYEGTVEIFEDETWTSFQEEGIAEATGLKYGYNNVTSIVQDPTDANHHYASAYGGGIFEFRDGKYVSNLNSSNSILETAIEGSSHYTRVSQLQYDKQGNLWITNSHAVSPLKILTKEGKLINLYYEELREQPTVTNILFDHNGLTWVVVMRSDAGLFCIDNGGTPYDVKDDRTRFISPRFTDQDGNSIAIDYIYDIAEDQEGDIWILTNKGPYVMRSPFDFFSNNFHFTKIKVPRNDGSGYADYLLDGVYTTCIAIDDANRKWIGTLSNGLYLVSADGYETIHHFTADNSPLPSDNIKDIAIQGSTGEVFIATDCGLVSFRSDATTPAEEYDKNSVYAFPNPVSPDYEGIITIVGLKASSTVKILSTGGSTVASGISLGGSFTWNGKLPDGRRAPSGVYFVLATDEEGREGIATKILFIH